MCKLVKELSVPERDLQPFDGNPLEYIYFMSIFTESVKKKIEEPKGRLAQLIQYTTGEAKDLIKNFINGTPEYGYNSAMKVVRKQYGNPHILLSSYRKEVRQLVPLKVGDATALRKLINLSFKCQTNEADSHYNPLTMLFVALSKSLTCISLPRLLDIVFLICFVLISFASMTRATIFYIFKHLVVNKPILEMMVSSVTVKLTRTYFLNSGSFLLTGLILLLFVS